MAAAKKPTNKKPAAKKKSSKQQAKTKTLFQSSNKQIAVMAAFVFALFMGAVVFIDAGSVWGHLRNFFFGVFGIYAYLIPIFIVFCSVVSAIGKDTREYKYRVIESVIIFLLVISFIYIVKVDDSLSYGEQIKTAFLTYKTHKATPTDGSMVYGFGVLGAVFGGLPLLITGANKLAAGIIVILLFFVLLMLFTGTTLIKLIHSLKAPAEAVGEYAEEKMNNIKESYETVSTDIHEKRARDAERRRAESEAAEAARIDIPLDTKKGKPDMGINDIFTDASQMEPKPKKSKKKIEQIIAEAEASEDEDIDLLSSFEEAPPENVPTVEEILNAKKIRSEQKLDEAVEAVNAQTENADNTDDAEEDIPDEFNAQPEEAVPEKEYELPPIDCLDMPKNSSAGDDSAELNEKASKIVKTLQSFGVGTKIVDICKSPSVTRFELQPDPGVKISRITSLSDDIAMNLAASGVRIEAPIPNKNAVGIEVPNSEKTSVTLREIIDSPAFKNAKSKLNVALGRDIQGEPTCADLAKMPHLLVAGTTGSGKSVCLNAMIVSLLFNATPDEVKLIMIDPKKVEFTVYRSIPHLLVPVVADPRKAAGALAWAVAEMDKRYALFAEKGVRNLQGYNNYAVTENLPKMPQIVIIIDELSDLMMAASNEVEDSICRLAQKARAAGMHLIVATQRPSVDVITGLIKANIPSRIAFAVKSQIDSRTIIDTQGAEKLLGYGDMLYCPVGLSKPVRVQGSYVSDDEIERVIDHVKSQGEVKYDDDVMKEIELKAAQDNSKKKSAEIQVDATQDADDEMIPKAIEVVVENGMASTTLLQRKLKLGYARAARIVDELAEKGIIGPYEGSKPRKVLITKEQWYEMQALSASNTPKQLTLEDVAPAQMHEEQQESEESAEHNYFGNNINSNSYEDM